MRPGKQRLIHDLLDPQDARRTQTLLAGGRILRRRRYTRVATRVLALALVASMSLWCLAPEPARQATVPPPVLASKTPLPIKIHSLTDEELLALFPDTPVGLATLANGKKKLIFPRPGDEERFIRRL